MKGARHSPLTDDIVRIWVLFGVMTLMILLLGGFLWRIQVARGHSYEDDLQRQSVRRVRLPGIRGKIYDRADRVLAENTPQYDIALYLEELRRPGKWQKTVDHVEDVLAGLEELVGRPPDIDEDDIWNHIRKRLPLPLFAWKGIDETVMARLAEQGIPYRGVDVQVEAIRTYPEGSLACHTIGYVGRADPPEEEEPYHFYVPEMEGKAGIERRLDSLLRGEAGGRLLRVDVAGVRRHDIAFRPPRHGFDVRLSIDARIQMLAESVIADESGSVVIMDPRNGDVLALASSPGYNLNDFIPAISLELWNGLREDERIPLLNRAISGGYAPGSTFKPITGLAALEAGDVTLRTVFDCPGYFMLGRARFNCWLHRGHGPVNMQRAIEGSCNVYFFHAALACGHRAVIHMADAIGLGKKTDIELDGEISGLVPDDYWKQKTFEDAWRDGDTCNIAIGQGALVVTPLQMAILTSVLANRGTVYKPRLVLGTWNPETGSYSRVLPEVVNRMDWTPAYIDTIRAGMRDVVMSPTGTGRKARIPDVVVAGKTGTAEFGRKEDRKRHAWMIAFAPYDEPRYAIALLVDEGVSGGETSAPRMQAILQGLFHGNQPTGGAG